MADTYLSKTGLQYYHSRIKTLFPSKTEFDALSDEVDDLIAEGGEPNVIEVVKVNDTPLTPDANKAVNVTVPTATSDLTNDGDGDSPFATEEYVATHGGKIDVIAVNNTDQPIVSKRVNLTVPTKVSDIANDSQFQTLQQVTDAIDEAIAGVTQFSYEIVQTLPASGAAGTIYLVPSTADPSTYDEYIWVENAWEQIGHTGEIDLSEYWGKSELVAITTAEIDQIVA